ncbi:XRE family transcriptional regulator [Streptomyces sp. NPDC058175]|uniref:XRE family transcriptional regulator n=1 Tax=Streptomyces sp. NPDC058175 TaxID=3346367 RepID=UPI0036E753AF
MISLYRGVVVESRNERLAAWMADTDMKVPDLTAAVNDAIGGFTGRPGTTSERTVFRWLSGENQWPQAKQRRALEIISSLSVTALGFEPRGNRKPTPAPSKDPSVHRRRFLTAVPGTALAGATAASSRPSRVGTADVIRLRDRMKQLIEIDAARGGHSALERAALAGAEEALRLQRNSTTQRVRQRLFGIAADYTATAAWSLIDARDLDTANAHLERALTYAGMAQDADMTMQVWNLRAMLARQREEYGEAVAAAQAAQATAITRRSPLHNSLAHARLAIGLAHSHEPKAALRSLGRAEDALSQVRGDQVPPVWIAFYGAAELYSITAIVRDHVGDPAQAEAASHRALSALPESYRRNRANATARLALAQLHQGEAEHACATSADAFAIMAEDPLPGRMRSLLGDFHRELITRAPARLADEWTDRYRTEWSTPA